MDKYFSIKIADSIRIPEGTSLILAGFLMVDYPVHGILSWFDYPEHVMLPMTDYQGYFILPDAIANALHEIISDIYPAYGKFEQWKMIKV